MNLQLRNGGGALRPGLIGGWLFTLLMVLPVAAAVPLTDYAERLSRARKIIDQLIESEATDGRWLSSLTAVKDLLPQREVVEFEGQEVRVDNAWLSEAVDDVFQNAAADLELRRALLGEISERLLSLEERVEAAGSQSSSGADDRRAQLDRILARPEYGAEVEQESIIKKWLKQLAEALRRLLSKLRPASAPVGGVAIGGAVEGIRILVLAVVLAALIFGSIYLGKRLWKQRKSVQPSGPREVLGETIGREVTAQDLLMHATELARQGDYRAAIRRVYLAVLIEMEHRGRLQLHRSKTNRDYLDDLRSMPEIFPPFSAMTWVFEKAWYGQTRATEEEFNGVLSQYQDSLK
ncbi:MAG TPA: DUF4129 domain-containing protein [Blastocatellia bacterium]|nr:DUF4129 domain-containing protein [Blastocatellia bacterium]